MDTAAQYDLADFIGQHWYIITEAFQHGLPKGFDANTGLRIPRLAEIGILDSAWNKLATPFEAVVLDVAAGRDVTALGIADFLCIAARYDQWHVSAAN
jgi:hypothetical protein